jgi:hypothetical protein
MKNAILIVFAFLFFGTFVLAQTYDGDGTYESISAGDTITADNGYSLNFVEIRRVGIAGGMNNGFYEYFSPDEGKIGNFTLVDVNNPTTRFYVLNSLDGTPVINVTFTRSSPTASLYTKVVSLTQSEEPDEQEEVGNAYTQNTNNQDIEKSGFFKRSWTWFKCLFSRKC